MVWNGRPSTFWKRNHNIEDSGFSTIRMADDPYCWKTCMSRCINASANGKSLVSSFLHMVYCVQGGDAMITSGLGHRVKSKECTSAMYIPGPNRVGVPRQNLSSILMLYISQCLLVKTTATEPVPLKISHTAFVWEVVSGALGSPLVIIGKHWIRCWRRVTFVEASPDAAS